MFLALFVHLLSFFLSSKLNARRLLFGFFFKMCNFVFQVTYHDPQLSNFLLETPGKNWAWSLSLTKYITSFMSMCLNKFLCYQLLKMAFGAIFYTFSRKWWDFCHFWLLVTFEILSWLIKKLLMSIFEWFGLW